MAGLDAYMGAPMPRKRETGIRVDIYEKILNRVVRQRPEDHFERLYSPVTSWLALPENMMRAFFWRQGERSMLVEGHTWSEVRAKYVAGHLKQSQRAQATLIDLKRKSQECVVFLVGRDRNPNNCIRSLLKQILERPNLIDEVRAWGKEQP